PVEVGEADSAVESQRRLELFSLRLGLGSLARGIQGVQRLQRLAPIGRLDLRLGLLKQLPETRRGSRNSEEERNEESAHDSGHGRASTRTAILSLEPGAGWRFRRILKGPMKSRASARSLRGRNGEAARRSGGPRRPARPFTENYREIVELAPVGIFSSTPAGRFNVVNQAFARMLGYDSAAELLRVDIPRDLYLDPADRQKIIEEYEKSSGIVRIEALLKKKDGSPLPVRFDGRVVRDAKGRTLGYDGFVHDITESKRVSVVLRRSDARFRAL